MNLGYLTATAIFAVLFVVAVRSQIAARGFQPWLYWATIIATTTVGTTLADFATRSLGIGYAGGSALLLVLLLASLAIWYRSMGAVSVVSIRSPRAEMFYWVTIMLSQTLGTALGDWMADTAGFGYLGAAAVFGGVLIVVAACYFWTRWSRTACSGRHSCSRARWGQWWATSSTSPWPRAVWHSVDIRHRRR